MTRPSGQTHPLQAVRHALRVLEAVAERPDGVAPAQLSRRSGLPPGELAALLPALRREGYVQQLPDGALVAGRTLHELASGDEARERLRRQKLNRVLDELRDSLGAAVYLGRYDDGELAVPHVSRTRQTEAVHEWVDFRAAAHATAIGKCLLSQLDHEGRQDHFARHKAARLTSRTITDPGALLAALDRQPATVPVLDLQEYAVGTLCAAVPLTAGSSVACLALSLPVGQAHRLRRTAEALNRRAGPALLSLTL